MWTLDLVHSAMVSAANWQNLIAHFGQWDTLDFITWCVTPVLSRARRSGRVSLDRSLCRRAAGTSPGQVDSGEYRSRSGRGTQTTNLPSGRRATGDRRSHGAAKCLSLQMFLG